MSYYHLQQHSVYGYHTQIYMDISFCPPKYCFILYICNWLYSHWLGHLIVQFLNLLQGLKYCLDGGGGGSTHHEAATYAQDNTSTE
jgi:hypothetical protein